MNGNRRRRVANIRRDVRRQPAHRESYSRVLIVAEGQKTEASYFNGVAKHYRLSTANIVVLGQGADPAAVVREAIKLKRHEQRRGDAYDRVFCVFDRDGHTQFKPASDRARANGIDLARSWPCFEYWLLLHFAFSRKPYSSSGARSRCDACIRELRRHMPDYRKAQDDVFVRLLDRLEPAKARAARAQDDCATTKEPNPSTEVHDLVDFLQTLKPLP